MEGRAFSRIGYYSIIFILMAASSILSGCSHAPSQEVLGSFFPSWMLCAAGGVLLTLAIRHLVVKAGIDPFVPARMLVYWGLAIAVTCVLWLGWFGN